MKEESFNRIENESFYSSPPFNYRPSIVEYLTSLKITERGIIADIMHLDRKGNINIEKYGDGFFEVSLKKKDDLNDNELFLWDFLEKQLSINAGKISNTGTIYLSSIKKIVWSYERLVIDKAGSKFGSKVPFIPGKSILGYIFFGFVANIVLMIPMYFVSIFISFIMFFLMFFSDPLIKSIGTIVSGLILILSAPAFLFIISYPKLQKSKFEMKYLFHEIILSYAKLFIWMLIAGGALSLSGLFLFFIFFNPVLIILIVLFYFIIYPIYFYFFGKIAYKFAFWLWETEATASNRLAWLEFKDFIYKNSALESKPLKYYELWGEFYYYALAVGAIKNYK